MEAANVPVTAQRSNGFLARVGATFRDILGQFITKQFWKDLARTLAQEAIATFFMTLGGTFLFYGRNKRNKDIVAASEAATGGNGNAAKAFGGYQPNSSYQPSSSYPVSTSPGGDTRFPGFGPR